MILLVLFYSCSAKYGTYIQRNVVTKVDSFRMHLDPIEQFKPIGTGKVKVGDTVAIMILKRVR